MPKEPDRYCRIASGDKPADIVWQSASVIAFRKRRGRAPVHIKVIPRQHITSLLDLQPGHAPLLAEMVAAVQSVAALLNLRGFTVEMNVGSYQRTQHLHWHILGEVVGQ